MNILQLTPGAGGMSCGNCFRDNALVAALRRLGHPTLMVPLYLPMTLDEDDQSAGTPVFFGGINVYLEQKLPWYRRAPGWLHRIMSAPALLHWAGGRAAKTRAEEVGDITLSMIRGEDGNQAREIEDLLAWLRTQPGLDVVCLSNALLIGLARRLKSRLDVPVVCFLQGEDSFLDSLPVVQREVAWRTLVERAAEVDLFIAPSRYFGDLMTERLRLKPDRVRVIFNGINLDGYVPAATPPNPPTLGYFARMCREKGLDTLVEAFLLLKQRDRVKDLKLLIGGSCGPADEPFVNSMRQRLTAACVFGNVEFHTNPDRAGKQAFLRSLSVFSVPALYGEAFGLYLMEALASGVPVVQPRHAAFPELIAATGGGELVEPGSPVALADGLERLLLDPTRARALGAAGRQAVEKHFTVERMARETLRAYETVLPT